MTSARARIQRRLLLRIGIVVCTITPVFNVLTTEPTIRAAFQGLADSAVVTLLVGGFLLFVRDGCLRLWFRHIGFWPDLALSSAIMLALFLVGRGIGLVATSLDPGRFLRSFTEPHLLYALPYFAVVSVAVQFVVRMNRMIGANVLGYFMAGVYVSPKAEDRIFLFVDLQASTQLAERLGSARYFELLRRFVDELSEPVLATRGEIYQYAGDEVVITWPMEEGLRAANCVRCFFAVHGAVAAHADRYERDFGVVPRFRGGLHGGQVTSGELGDLRQQIAFVGDILNTAARLEEFAKRAGLDLVVSGALLDRLALPPEIAAECCGDLSLRGKEAPVAAWSLSLAPIGAVTATRGGSP